MSNFILIHDWVFFFFLEKSDHNPGKYYCSMINEHQIKNNSHFDTWLSWNVLKNNSYFVHICLFFCLYLLILKNAILYFHILIWFCMPVYLFFNCNFILVHTLALMKMKILILSLVLESHYPLLWGEHGLESLSPLI